MISDELKAAGPDTQKLLAKLRGALDTLTEAIAQARGVLSEVRANLAEFEEPAVIRFDDALIARKARLAAEVIPRPHWDSVTRVLSLGDRIVKEFRVPAQNQEAVLAAFQEEGWPHRIDDPLPFRAGIKAKYRLHFTIGRLNQSERHRLIRFFGDGTGEGVCWSLVEAATDLLAGSTDGRSANRRAA